MLARIARRLANPSGRGSGGMSALRLPKMEHELGCATKSQSSHGGLESL